MKALFGEIIVAGSGKLGGHVHSRNRGGAYVRTKVTPLNPDTSFQQAARAVLADFSSEWRTLTQAQRDAWDLAVEDYKVTDVFGAIRRPSGKNLFVRINANLDSVGVASITDPVAVAQVPEPVLTGVTIDEGTAVFDIAFTNGFAAVTFQVWATASKSPGVSFAKPFFRLFDTILGGSVSPADADTTYRARFGAPVVGQKIFVRIVPVNITTGQKGVGSEAFAIVT